MIQLLVASPPASVAPLTTAPRRAGAVGELLEQTSLAEFLTAVEAVRQQELEEREQEQVAVVRTMSLGGRVGRVAGIVRRSSVARRFSVRRKEESLVGEEQELGERREGSEEERREKVEVQERSVTLHM